MRTTDTGRPMTGSPAHIDRVPQVREEASMSETVPVRVLRGFNGATTSVGTKSRWYSPDDPHPVMVEKALADTFAAGDLVELLDPATVSVDGAPTEAYVADVDADGLPAEGTPLEALLAWIESTDTTGKLLVAYLAKQGVTVPRGVRVPQIREQAAEHARATVAPAEPKAGVSIGSDLSLTLVTPAS